MPIRTVGSRASWLAVAVSTLALATPPSLCADVFVLKQGGRVQGDWLNPDQSPQTEYVIGTAGGQVRLRRAQVEQVIRSSPAESQYAEKFPRAPDTVTAHWKLAEWCAENGLTQQREDHLRRILELEPDHAQTRALLGYRRIAGQWMTRDEQMTARGMQLYKGRYRTLQEVQLLEQEEKDRLAMSEWLKKLKRWRGWLSSRDADRIKAAQTKILAIRDPYAIKALIDSIQVQSAHPLKLRPYKLLYAEALKRVILAELAKPTRHPHVGVAIQALVDRSLVDPDEEVRFACMDRVVEIQHPPVIGVYIRALSSKNPVEVNRAAMALEALGSPDAIEPLIDALVTSQKLVLQKGDPSQTSATFSRDGGAGLSVGSAPTVVHRQNLNRHVLSALVSLAGGVNFDFDKQAWKKWYAANKRARPFNARRD